MSDVLSQGGDREPGRRWRWVIPIAVLVLATVLIAEHLPRHRHGQAHPRPDSASQAAVPLVPLGLHVHEPGGVSGLAMSRRQNLRLPLAGPQPAWLWLGTGHEQPIGGLPRVESGYQFNRVPGGWAVQAGSDATVRCGSCSGPQVPVYFLADGARSATRLGTANQVAPGASARALWLTSYPAGSDMRTTAATAQEVSVTGVPSGPSFRLPVGYALDQATDRGLLLVPTAQPGTPVYTLWRPGAARASRSFEGVIAASATRVAWTTRCAPLCRVRVVDLATGRQTTVALPGASSAVNGAFSPDGKFLALQVSFDSRGDDGALAMQLDVVPAASSRPVPVPGLNVSSDALVSFGWPARGDDLVAELSFIAKVQVASWYPGARQLVVAVINSGSESGALILR
ncbi:MAG TPA: hypothetical protein VIF35_03605 [Streptosporangiaceae bacterium]